MTVRERLRRRRRPMQQVACTSLAGDLWGRLTRRCRLRYHVVSSAARQATAVLRQSQTDCTLCSLTVRGTPTACCVVPSDANHIRAHDEHTLRYTCRRGLLSQHSSDSASHSAVVSRFY